MNRKKWTTRVVVGGVLALAAAAISVVLGRRWRRAEAELSEELAPEDRDGPEASD